MKTHVTYQWLAMLIILSDLHLNDGSTGETLSPEAFALLADRLRELAATASWRSDDAYRPIERIDLVLLGDVFDLLHSARWHAAESPRPWDDPQSPGLIDLLAKITGDILAANKQGLAALRALTNDRQITLPPILRSSRPAADGDEQPVLVRIHYMVGNHDWFYHLPGAAYDGLRRKLVEQMGLANRADRPFPHDITESDELLQTMRRHKVTARHGDVFDPLSYEGDRDLSGLGDAIELDLIGRFAVQVEQTMGHELPDATVLAPARVGQFPSAALGARMDRRHVGADVPAAGRAEAGEAALGSAGRGPTFQPARPRARRIELGEPH